MCGGRVGAGKTSAPEPARTAGRTAAFRLGMTQAATLGLLTGHLRRLGAERIRRALALSHGVAFAAVFQLRLLETPDLVTQARGFLDLEVGGGRAHFGFEPVDGCA